MEIAFISLIIVLLAVLVMNEIRHSRDRADFKELSLNQQNHIMDLREILRWRSGMPPLFAKPEETSASASLPPVQQTPNIPSGQPFSFNPSDNDNHQTAVKKPIGRAARIAAQEEEERIEAMKNG